MQKKEKPKINCPTFQKQEPAIKELTDRINKAKEPSQKIEYAEGLLKEVNILLICPEHKEENLDCRNCRTIANLRRATAELIIRTKKLI